MSTFDSISLENGLFSLFKGEPGLRKSTCALSYPMPQYWISTDQKMEALVRPSRLWNLDTKQIDYDDYNNWDKPRKFLEGLQVNCKYKTIIIDSITSIGDCMTSQVKKEKKDDKKGKSLGGIIVSGFDEFNAEAAAFQDLIALTKDIHKYHKINIIMIAHVIAARKDNDVNKLTHHSRTIVTGGEKISAKIASYMTEVYHFNIGTSFDADAEGNYELLTVHTGNDYARTSLDLPRKIQFNDKQLYKDWIAPSIAKMSVKV